MSFKDYIIGILFSLLVVSTIWLSFEIQERPTRTTNVSIDSTSQTTSVDTTFAPDTSITLEPEEIPEPDTVYKDTSSAKESEDNSEYTKLRSYTTTVSDSLINANITTVVRGYLVDQNISYTPQYPLKIRVKTNTTVTKTITKVRNPVGYPHIQAVGYSNLNTRHGTLFMLGWTFSNGNSVSFGYDPINNTYSVGMKYNLKNLL